MARTPARRFLAPNGRTSTKPLRPEPQQHLALPLDPTQQAEAERVQQATRLCDEPECPSKAIVDAQADLARTYDLLRYSAELEVTHRTRRLLTLEQRMADVQRRAKLRHADVSGELHAIKMMLARARNGGRQDPPAAYERIERIEARLDYRPDLADAA